jgi:hypothetical protein
VSTSERAPRSLGTRTAPLQGGASDHDLELVFDWVLASLAVLSLWIRPIGSSLRVDEIGTWWVIRGSADDALHRAALVQGQSPLYYLISWGGRHVFGTSELGLRLPSLILMLLAAALVYRIGQRLANNETARLALIIFLVWPAIAFTASDARPYALATLLTVASVWALIHWLDRGGRSRWALFVVLAASLGYAHPVFGLVLIPLGLYSFIRLRGASTRVTPGNLRLAYVAVLALDIPIVFEILALWRRQTDWSIPSDVTVQWVMQLLIPPAVAAVVVIACLVSVRMISLRSIRPDRETQALLFSWFLIPTIALVGLGIFSSIVLLAARYLLCIAPAGALLAAFAIRSFEPAHLRRMLIATIVVLSVLELASPYKEGDLRGAAALVRAEEKGASVTLMTPGFQESMQRSWFDDQEKLSLLTSPSAYYTTATTVVQLPIVLDSSNLPFVRARVDQAAEGTGDLMAIVESGSAYVPWLNEYLGLRGWVRRDVGSVNLFTVIRFSRSDRGAG